MRTYNRGHEMAPNILGAINSQAIMSYFLIFGLSRLELNTKMFFLHHQLQM